MMKLRAQVAVQNIKNHVKSNKFGYCMTAVAIGAVALLNTNSKTYTKFLIEKNIDPDEFYCPELFEEKNQ